MQFCKANMYYFEMFLESLLALVLRFSRKDNYYLTEEKYKHIRRCAEAAYPNDEYYIYAECSTVKEFLKYGCCANASQVYAITGKNWYFIAIKRLTYVGGYDFASASGNCYDILAVISTIYKLFNGKRCRLLCRESTSYPLVIRLAQAGKCSITEDKIIMRNGEQNHMITLVLRKSNK